MRWLLLVLAVGVLCAQSNIDAGKQLYGVNCSNCHGARGDFVSGVALMSGTFRRASSDNELVAIIEQGIAGTPMPPASLTDAQARSIVAYLRHEAERPGDSGADTSRGQALVGSKNCLNCHRIQGKGSRVGPDLSNIGMLRTAGEIERSILEPNAEVLAENRYIRITTREGTLITGRVLNEDTFSIQLIDSKEKLVSLSKANLREYWYLKDSPMPSYRGKLSAGELQDLVGYLVSLKGL